MKTEEEGIKEDQDQEFMMIIEEEEKEVDIEEEEIIIVSQENIESLEHNMMVKDLQDKIEVDTESRNNMMAKDLQDKIEEVIEETAKEAMVREVEIEEEEDIKIEEQINMILLIIKSEKYLFELKLFEKAFLYLSKNTMKFKILQFFCIYKLIYFKNI